MRYDYGVDYLGLNAWRQQKMKHQWAGNSGDKNNGQDRKKFGGRCFLCGMKGHMKKDCHRKTQGEAGHAMN